MSLKSSRAGLAAAFLKNSVRAFLKNHALLVSCAIAVLTPLSISYSASPAAFFDFFVTAELKPMVGLSCSSEAECQALCQGKENCQKPITTCLNCVGSRSPYMDDFFNHMGDFTTACFDQEAITMDSEALFKAVSMIPLTPASAYNPLGLKDQAQLLKFATLCPTGTQEPTAVAVTNSYTHAVLAVPVMKCDHMLYPLVRNTEDCAQKIAQLHTFIQQSTDFKNALQSHADEALNLGLALPIQYNVLQFSDYAEVQYLRCDTTSQAVCENLCHSPLSCAVPLNSLKTAKAIAAFNKHTWNSCEIEAFSPRELLNYFSDANTVAFSSDSLSQSYDLPAASGGFKDFTVINAMLNEFSGVFTADRTDRDAAGSSFFVSGAYRAKLKSQMEALCDGNTAPIILGHGNKIERVFCRADRNGYFRTLISEGETCGGKNQSIANAPLAGGNP